jgi:molecular chaperone DnaK (HSP70)
MRRWRTMNRRARRNLENKIEIEKVIRRKSRLSLREMFRDTQTIQRILRQVLRRAPVDTGQLLPSISAQRIWRSPHRSSYVTLGVDRGSGRDRTGIAIRYQNEVRHYTIGEATQIQFSDQSELTEGIIERMRVEEFRKLEQAMQAGANVETKDNGDGTYDHTIKF